MEFSRKFFLVLVVCQIGMVLSPTTYAQSRSERKRFYAGMEMGIGLLKLYRNNLPEDRRGRFAMGFCGGYSPLRELRIGINLSGWLIEAENLQDPFEGIGIGNTYVQVELFPIRKLKHLFLNLEGGISNYRSNHLDGYIARGRGTKFGLGYEYDVAKHTGLSLTVNYCTGQFGDVSYPLPTINQHYNSVEVLLGIIYH